MFHVEHFKKFRVVSSELRDYLKTKDFLVTGEEFSLLLDPEREMLITSPQPVIENLNQSHV